MFCRKCGGVIPDDSNFCPKCGTCNNIDIESDDSGKVNLKKSNDKATNQNNSNQNKNNNQLKTIDSDLKCPKCGKPIMPTWTKCIHCGAFNPFNTDIQPSISQTIVTPPPQVIIKEERVVVHETPKQEEKGCGTIIGEIIGGLFTLGIAISILQSCFGCVG